MNSVFEKIIEKLEEQKKGNPFVYGKNDKSRDASVSRQTLDYAIEIVNQEAEKYNNGWIPCDGIHFPEENVYVRVAIWTKTEKIGFRRDGKWFVYGSDGLTEATVLAWQPTELYTNPELLEK